VAEIISIAAYYVSHIAVFLYMVLTHKYVGDVQGLPYENVNVLSAVLLLALVLISYLLMYFFYKKTRLARPSIHFVVNKERLGIFVLVVLVVQIVYFLFTGNGRVGGGPVSGYSFIFNFFNINAFFPFYYFLGRAKKPVYIVNILLFCALRLLQGWTSFILDFAFFEMFLYFRRHPDKKLRLPSVAALSVALLGIGGFLYQFVSAFKHFIRNHTAIVLPGYLRGLISLAARLSFFPQSLTVIQNIDAINALYQKNPIPLKEIQGALRMILPRFLMPDKDFRTLPNLVIQAAFPTVPNLTGSSVGLFAYAYELFRVDLASALVWLVLLVALVWLMRFVIYAFQQEPSQMDFLYFYMLLLVVTSGSLESVFAARFVPALFFIPFLLLFQVVRINRGFPPGFAGRRPAQSDPPETEG